MQADVITMTQRELQRVPVLTAVLAKQLTQRDAAQTLALSTRQVRRLTRRVQQDGPRGLAHRSRGRPSNARLSAALRARVLTLLRTQSPDFGPTLAGEMLATRHRIRVSDETLRTWMRHAGFWAGRRRPRPHRQWRERQACAGALVQVDGSHHAWLEGRGPRLVLMAYIDDATSRVFARFYDYEGTGPALDSFARYARRYGVPQRLYVDRHPTYRSPGRRTVADELAGRARPQSQFERAVTELGVTLIPAHSPQAKGRVERLFRTLQDRLVKALRLANACTRPEANRVLGRFLPAYNRRFTCAPRQPGDVHRPVPTQRLQDVLCVKEPRIVANDGTIQVHGHRWQLHAARPLARRRVLVTRTARGRMRVWAGAQTLAHRPLPAAMPMRVALPRRRGHTHPPPPDHPWRQYAVRRPATEP